MPPFAQNFQPGALSKEWKSQLARLEKDRTVGRFWNRDLSLWPTYKSRKDNEKNLLNWLDLAEHWKQAPRKSRASAIAWKATV